MRCLTGSIASILLRMFRFVSFLAVRVIIIVERFELEKGKAPWNIIIKMNLSHRSNQGCDSYRKLTKTLVQMSPYIVN